MSLSHPLHPSNTPASPPAGESASAAIEILSIERLNPPVDLVTSFFLDEPRTGDSFDAYTIQFSGWVLGTAQNVKHVALCFDNFDDVVLEIRQLVLDIPRPDVLEAFPTARPQTCGYQGRLTLLGSGQTLSYLLVAVLEDDQRLPLFRITVRHKPMGTFQPQVQPLMVTTLGRSGSKLLMLLLDAHPDIIAYEPRLYEPRVASYWIDLFIGLAQPNRYLQTVTPNDLGRVHWWLDNRLPNCAPPGPEMLKYLGGDALGALLDFARARIDDFYHEVARQQKRPAPRFFVEKTVPRLARIMLKNACPGAREIVLVRDFRDAIYSVLSFNQKIGRDSFGRERVSSDVDYVRWYRDDVNRIQAIVRDPIRRPFLLRYEDLFLQPALALRNLLSFLEIDSSDASITAMLAGPSSDVFSSHATSPDAASSIGRWRSESTPEMRQAFREHLDDLLVQFGYEPTPPHPA